VGQVMAKARSNATLGAANVADDGTGHRGRYDVCGGWGDAHGVSAKTTRPRLRAGPSGSGLTCRSGNFADELGEDFLGLRDLGVAQEHGMSSLTVPSSLFYGRKKRAVDAAHLGYVALSLSSPLPAGPLDSFMNTHLADTSSLQGQGKTTRVGSRARGRPGVRRCAHPDRVVGPDRQ
jgi:hypothetical protein